MATMNAAAKRVRGIIRETHRWCAQPRNDRRDSQVLTLKKDMKSGDAAGAAVNLGLMASWYGQHGARAILDGDMQGWADIDRAIHYLWMDGRLTKQRQASVGACVVAAALLLDHEELAEGLIPTLIAGMDDQKSFIVWSESAFATFMLKLWGLYKGVEIDVERPNVAPLRVYQGILDAWDDDAALGPAVLAACDYHLEQTVDKAPYPEFTWIPFLLFPADILVIGTIRRRLGLSMPEVYHPLLDTPLAKIPPSAERPRMGPDPLFDEVLEMAYAGGHILRPGEAPPTIEQRIARIVRQLRDQQADRACPEERNQAVQRIRAAVTRPKGGGAAMAAGEMPALAEWHGRRGTLAILDGKVEGWADIDRSFFYRAWAVQMGMEPPAMAMRPVAMVARALANALVFGEATMAEHLAAQIVATPKNRLRLHGWEHSPFAGFMTKLWGLYIGQGVNLAGSNDVHSAPLASYQSILDAWQDDNALASALFRACDYHVEQAHPSVANAEFVEVPYSLFPVDILAIFAVRTKLGLTTPNIDHPLLKTPLAVVPPERPRMGADPLLDQVLERAKKDGLLA